MNEIAFELNDQALMYSPMTESPDFGKSTTEVVTSYNELILSENVRFVHAFWFRKSVYGRICLSALAEYDLLRKTLIQTDILINTYINIGLRRRSGKYTRNRTLTVKRAADNKWRYAHGEGSIPPFVIRGFQSGLPLAHDCACKV